MSGFLHYLAGMALGNMPTGSAQISLPSRFARPSLSDAASFEVIEEIEAPSPMGLPATAPETAEPDPRGPRMATITQTASRLISRPPSPAPLVRQVPLNSDKPRTLERATETRRPAPEPQAKVSTWEVERTSRHATPSMSAVSRRRSLEASRSSVPTAVPIHTDRGSARRAQPLSEAAVAGRSAAMRQEPPVVHVNIDRIDIRASSPAKPNVEQRRVRAQPSVSLSDFLRGEGRGRG